MSRIPKPKFNLKSPKANGDTLIFLVFRYRGKRLLYSTQLFIHPNDWDSKLQRPIELEDRPELWMIRNKLDDLASRCKSIYIEADYGVISVKKFKQKLDGKEDKPKQKSKPKIKIPSLLEFLDQELKEMKASNMKATSLKMFKNQIRVIKDFSKSRGQFTYEEVDWNLRLEFIDWLAKKKITLSYGNKVLNTFRQFMERARRKKYHQNISYQGMGWTITRKKAKGQKITLSLEELELLASLPLYGLKEKVRDLLLIGAGTGQRYGDYSKFTPKDFQTTIKGVPILSIISQKTAVPAKVPLTIFPWLIPTLEKYNYTSPTLALQIFNDHIKIICQEAGIDEKILKVIQLMGRRPVIEKTYVLKYQEIASHVCRRSFATNLYRMGYQLSQIMPMTGHTTESQLREYIGIDAEENAEEVARSIELRNNARL